jgi:hypothetical protein
VRNNCEAVVFRAVGYKIFTEKMVDALHDHFYAFTKGEMQFKLEGMNFGTIEMVKDDVVKVDYSMLFQRYKNKQFRDREIFRLSVFRFFYFSS